MAIESSGTEDDTQVQSDGHQQMPRLGSTPGCKTQLLSVHVVAGVLAAIFSAPGF